MVTVEEFMARPETDLKEELIDGEIIAAMTHPVRAHSRVTGRLFNGLYNFAEPCGLGEVYGDKTGLFLDRYNAPGPDVMYVSRERFSQLSKRGIEGGPDLVVEVLSPSTRKLDLGRKRELYAEHGATEYWVVDIDDRSVAVYRLQESAGAPKRTFREPDTLTTALLPGFEMRLAALFEGL